MIPERTRIQHRITSVIDWCQSTDDLQVQAEWACYVCVLISGYVEVSLRELLREYSGRRSGPHVMQFVSNKLKRLPNPTFGAIERLLGDFSSDWARQIKLQAPEEIRFAIDSTVNIRNDVAHGRQGEVSLGRAREYFERAKVLVNTLEIIIQ